ncbi:unnamed protein product [Tuber melanosporum]|uniref:(Perigord truffle) hypothetical protein n=1 Tax=Tuber melanosporum (strain Mel28) TaxID=656061 RepID=D5GPU6_TUBMM|nr:uncharacterized protein GSTUM_00012038001 [Tuber melanosporum]CAZ86539.1 unnamed protein product [Tuber melanosporum]
MFWRFGGYANISTLDAILEKPDVTLEDLLEESDLIQELKQQNAKLIEFLRREDVMWKLLEYVVAPKRSDPASEEAGNNAAEAIRLKYAYVCCEVLSSESWSMAETLVENLQPLRMFWSFLERPAPLDPLQAGYFTKVNETLLDRKTDEMMEFFKGLDNIVPKILKHVDCPMIMDLLLKIISMEKCEGGTGIVDWLHSQNLIPLLLSFLSSDHPATTQTSSGDFIKAIITISANASQNEQSCIGPNDLTRQLVSEACVQGLIRDMLNGGNPLTVGVGIVIEVIRKNNSDYDPDVGTGVDNIPSSRDPIYLGTLLRLFAKHVPDFMKLILTQCMVVTSEDGSKTEKQRELKAAFGETIEPLGFDRFKTCELMAELLHCSNMGLLNERGGESLLKGGRSLVDDLKTASIAAPLNPQASSIPQDRMDADLPPLPKEAFEKSKQPDDPEEDLLDLGGGSPYSTATFRSTGNSSFEEYETMIEKDFEGNPVVGDYLKMMFVENSVVPTILDFFFRFPWNNFLHNVVYDVVQQVFNGPMERGYNRALAIDLFATGRITERIVEGQKASDKVEAEKKMRLGYMGHLTLIAEEVVKFAERHPPEILGHKVIEKVSDPLWIEYVEETLAATRERDNAILGGVRPDMSVGPRQAVLNAVQAQAFNANGSSGSAGIGSGAGISGSSGGLLSGFGSSSDEEDEDMERDDEDDDEVNRLGLSGSSDQFASYISQEITNVDKFGSSDEEDDDDDISFATAPNEPPPPPPLPLNITRPSSATTATNTMSVGANAGIEIEGEEGGFEEIEEVGDFAGDGDSSDEGDDELISRGVLRRNKLTVTHKAEKRAVLEEDEGEVDFINEIHGLSLAGVGDQGKATSETSASVTTEAERISEPAAGEAQKIETK